MFEGPRKGLVIKNNFCLYFDVVMLFCADLEWKLVYVGSAESSEYDQVLGLFRNQFACM